MTAHIKMEGLRYHFVANIGTAYDLDMLRSLSWEEAGDACVHHAWIWPLYCQLRDRGWPVSIGYDLDADAINLVHGEVARYQLKGRDFANHFIIGIRADFRPFPFGNLEVVQNKASAGRRTFYMPHFPQPGLLPRDPQRTAIQNVAFVGQVENLGVRPDVLAADLENLGCRFLCKGLGEWHDLRDVDVLLGFRSLDTQAYNSKPPTKLFNAWLAGIPFIGGYDSALVQVGEAGTDFIRISSYRELLAEIEKLKNNSDYYTKFVESGTSRSHEFTVEKTTAAWEQKLVGIAEHQFLEWKKGSIATKMEGAIRGLAFDIWEQRVRRYGQSEVWGSGQTVGWRWKI